MAHRAPEPPTPEPEPRPELFTRIFWLVTIARVVRGAAVGAAAGLGSHVPDHLGGIPWSGLAVSTIIGAIMSLAASLGNQLIPETTPANVAAHLTGREH